jgi:hypothetical protein
MPLSTQIENIGPAIQLAIAPVFLLTAVAAMIGVHTTRLGRAVDRSRVIEEHQARGANQVGAPALGELAVIRRRMGLIYLAIVLDVLCALFVGLTIVLAFVDALAPLNLSWLIALLFVLAMLAFIASLAAFLREIFLAVGRACGGTILGQTDRR